ncbi:Sodium ATPase proteolipid component [Acholeplasma oculi]|uniref:V-type ATP synthase subunit K n=1 Tax=Acholeplasma oculi TaxID=35623 RepID=A0A061AHX3_9MOLU|nr:V-type ATP synthase subunit K [Acholeplasma oculi]CDR30572.1 V-type ATP synthase subunit K [Acholeplasma oculi]SKC46874.1 V/A-type H+-transporting ATPase subunit K [Acholeplasma oculi]SUT89262.1 Sodium ATPase proteolipid component [Acholeplasma oculi]
MPFVFLEFDGLTWALLGAALSAGLAGIGSAMGVSIAGRAATGVLSEKPELFGKVLLLQALSGTQGIYGFLVTVLMLVKMQWLTGNPIALTPLEGQMYFAASLPIAIVGLFSAIYQGKMSASSILMTGKRPEISTRGITMTALVETYAILALLISILMWTQLPG